MISFSGVRGTTEAMNYPDFAIGGFRDMKIQPSLERTHRHREILRA